MAVPPFLLRHPARVFFIVTPGGTLTEIACSTGKNRQAPIIRRLMPRGGFHRAISQIPLREKRFRHLTPFPRFHPPASWHSETMNRAFSPPPRQVRTLPFLCREDYQGIHCRQLWSAFCGSQPIRSQPFSMPYPHRFSNTLVQSPSSFLYANLMRKIGLSQPVAACNSPGRPMAKASFTRPVRATLFRTLKRPTASPLQPRPTAFLTGLLTVSFFSSTACIRFHWCKLPASANNCS